jgi:hypothetical protein
VTLRGAGERMDPRRVLGLALGAGPAEARAAWRAAARRHHPDRGGDPARFIAVKRAWRDLQVELKSDAVGRKDSGHGEDRSRPAPPGPPEPWTYGRAVRYLVRRVEADIEAMDDGTTGVAGREIVWLSDAGLEWEGFLVPWDLVDDQIMGDVVELLVVGAERWSA